VVQCPSEALTTIHQQFPEDEGVSSTSWTSDVANSFTGTTMVFGSFSSAPRIVDRVFLPKSAFFCAAEGNGVEFEVTNFPIISNVRLGLLCAIVYLLASI
jgi:hypothetical protein